MSDQLLRAPALPAHRVHAIKGPVSEALACVKHTYCTNGSKDVLVMIVGALLVLFFIVLPALRRRPGHRTVA